MNPAPVARLTKPRLGEVMVQLGFLTRSQLESTPVAGQRVGQALIARGLCSEDQVMHALSRQLGMPVLALDTPGFRCTAALSEAVARKHRAVVLEPEVPNPHEVLVAMAAPAKLDAQDAVRAAVGKSRVRFALTADAGLERAFARLYSPAPRTPTPPPAPALNEAGEVMARLDLSPRTMDAIRRAAADVNITPREVIRRAMESWASTRRAY